MHPKKSLYLDSNSGALLHPSVIEALQFFFKSPEESFLNPSSIHSYGRIAKKALAEARESIAYSLGPKVDPEQIIFTSSGSEANQLVVQSALGTLLSQGKSPHWVTTTVEHDSNRQMVSWVRARGGRVTEVEVDSQGVLKLDQLEEALTPDTALVSIVWVNNETGVISPIEKISELTQSRGISLHLDGAQAWGKLPINLNQLGAQWVTFSAHKIGAFAGTGILWVNRGVRAQAVILGKQEKGRRGGTENSVGIIAAGAAARHVDPELWAKEVRPLRDQLQSVIQAAIEGTCVNGDLAPRIANTLSLSFDRLEGEGLVLALDLAGYAVSAGSACSSGVLEPSHVLTSMGRTNAQAMAAIRISIHKAMEWEKLEGFAQSLQQVVERMRKRGFREPERK